MTFKRTRDSTPGSGYIAQQGNTGTVLWATCRDTEQVIQGAAKLKLPGHPGQLVFSTGDTGKDVIAPGETQFTQDPTAICTGDDSTASVYAGRYLSKWPLFSDLTANDGYLNDLLVGQGAVTFATYGGKSGYTKATGGVPPATSVSVSTAKALRTKQATMSWCGYILGGTNICLEAFTGPIHLYNYDGAILCTNPGFATVVGTTPSYNAWHHYAVSYGVANHINIYVDGVLQASSPETFTNTCFNLGGSSLAAGSPFSEPRCVYRNMRLYSKVLSSTEIAAIAAEDLV